MCDAHVNWQQQQPRYQFCGQAPTQRSSATYSDDVMFDGRGLSSV